MISLHYYAAQPYLGSVATHNNVVDRDVDELDEEAYESHDGETDPGCQGYLLELCHRERDQDGDTSRTSHSCRWTTPTPRVQR